MFSLLFLLVVCLLLGVPLFFLSRWVARKFVDGQAAQQAATWIATVVLTLLVFCGIAAAVFFFAFGEDAKYSFDAEKWAKKPEKRYQMVEDLVYYDLLQGMTPRQVGELLGRPDHVDPKGVWTYWVGSRTEKDDVLQIDFYEGRVKAVQGPYTGTEYEEVKAVVPDVAQ